MKEDILAFFLILLRKLCFSPFSMTYRFFVNLLYQLGFTGGIGVKNLPANAGDARDTDSIPGLGRSPGVGNGIPLQYSWPGKFHGQRSLAGYSPWAHKKSNMTEHNTVTVYQLEEVPLYLSLQRVFNHE